MKQRARPRRRRVVRIAALTVLAAAGAAAIALVRSTDWLASLGGRLSGERLDRARRSPNFADGRFRNSVPTVTMLPGGGWETTRELLTGKQTRAPKHPIPVEARVRGDFERPPESGLRITWLGHAGAVVEIDGLRVLTDPVWSARVSPSSAVGPRRFFEPPIPLEDLPPIDAVLISHDHYDHLDMATVRTLALRGTLFLVPLGVGAHLEKWGVAPAQIRELDWGKSETLGSVTLSAAPARHFSGRRLTDEDATQWASWILTGPRHRVFYSGDSGYFDGYRAIGEEHGPFDATLMSLGAYGPTWPQIHMNPEEVAQAHVDVRGGLLIPVHWGTFNLAFHDWNEPPTRLAAAAEKAGARLLVPRPGQMVEPTAPQPALERWWEGL